MAANPSPAPPLSTISELQTIPQRELEELIALEIQIYHLEKTLKLRRRCLAERLCRGATIEVGRFVVEIWRNAEMLEFLRIQDLKHLATVFVTCLYP
jgi:hypothetical protein